MAKLIYTFVLLQIGLCQLVSSAENFCKQFDGIPERNFLSWFWKKNRLGQEAMEVFICLAPLVHKYCSVRPFYTWTKCGSRGGKGVRTPPPGKSQVIWVSIGNKQLDPPPPLKNVGPPLEPWKMIDFILNWPFDFCKISWGLKKQKNNIRAFFVRLTWTPPPPLTKIPGSAHVNCLMTFSKAKANTLNG